MNPPEILDQYPKAADLFWQWLSENHLAESDESYYLSRTFPFQWGVFLAFFDDQGVKISLEYKPMSETWSICGWIGPRMFFEKGMYDTLEPAQLAALTAALSILEGRL